jgi:hypothetical protein
MCVFVNGDQSDERPRDRLVADDIQNKLENNAFAAHRFDLLSLNIANYPLLAPTLIREEYLSFVSFLLVGFIFQI